jgi:hypothetical protein
MTAYKILKIFIYDSSVSEYTVNGLRKANGSVKISILNTSQSLTSKIVWKFLQKLF